jgi:hypothetical protein
MDREVPRVLGGNGAGKTDERVTPIKLVHIFAAVENGARPLLVREHVSALESWVRASKNRPTHSDLQIIGVCFDPSADRSDDFPEIAFVHSNKPTARDILGSEVAQLPLVASILHYVPVDADWVIFSNSDIHLIDSAYKFIGDQIEASAGAISINRVTLPANQLGAKLDTVKNLLRSPDPHPGSDLFCFPRSAIEQFVFDNIFLGSPPVAKIVMTNLSLACGGVRIIEGSGVSYHFGDARGWESNSRLGRANSFFAVRALASLRSRHGRSTLRNHATRLGGRWGFLIAAVQLVPSNLPPTFRLIPIRLAEEIWRVASFFLRHIRAISRFLPRGLRLLKKLVRPLLRWSRLVRTLLARSASIRSQNLEVIIVSPGGVATTTLIKHVSQFVRTNDGSDSDGLKHIPRLPESYKDSETPVIFIAASSTEAAIASLRSRGILRIQATKLSPHSPDLLKVLFVRNRHLDDRVAGMIALQRAQFEEFARRGRVLVLEREALFESATRIQSFLGIKDDSFSQKFPRDRKLANPGGTS